MAADEKLEQRDSIKENYQNLKEQLLEIALKNNGGFLIALND
jgi:hypothetical protein